MTATSSSAGSPPWATGDAGRRQLLGQRPAVRERGLGHPPWPGGCRRRQGPAHDQPALDDALQTLLKAPGRERVQRPRQLVGGRFGGGAVEGGEPRPGGVESGALEQAVRQHARQLEPCPAQRLVVERVKQQIAARLQRQPADSAALRPSAAPFISSASVTAIPA